MNTQHNHQRDHLSLIRQSIAATNYLLLTTFVNPKKESRSCKVIYIDQQHRPNIAEQGFGSAPHRK
jgi:hypothetical protein